MVMFAQAERLPYASNFCLQAAMAAPPSSGSTPAENGTAKKKSKGGGGFVLGRGSAVFRTLVERAASGAAAESDADADLAAR